MKSSGMVSKDDFMNDMWETVGMHRHCLLDSLPVMQYTSWIVFNTYVYNVVDVYMCDNSILLRWYFLR